MSDLYPLLCEPVLKERIWGGRALAERYGKSAPDGVTVGESWEVADLAEGTSRIANGPLAGRTLTELQAEQGAALAGTAWPAGRFPLLVKLLDTAQDLSVQVHPSAADCARWFPGHEAKDETWIVVEAATGARVIHGVRPGVRPHQFERHARAGTIVQCLRERVVVAGMALRTAPGVVHALGAGVVALEIQQPSDSTFRLYDYGRGRELHVEEALRVTRLDLTDEPLLRVRSTAYPWGRHDLVVDVPAYRIERLFTAEPLAWQVSPRTAQTVTCLAGGGTLFGAGVGVELTAGATCLLPAGLGEVSFAPAATSVVVLAGASGEPLCEPIGGPA